MKSNPGKSHILLSNKKTEKVKINDFVLTSSAKEKLLGITLDSELTFKKHITDICSKVSQRIHVLSRITRYMSLNKRMLLVKPFVESQFNYCPLIWMFHSRRLNNKINNVHEKALRSVYSDYNPTFQELLDKDASFSVHHRNIQTLAIEIYKHIHGLSPVIMGEVFKINRTLPYNLRTQNDFSSRVLKIGNYGTETISFLAPKVWALVPEKLKECSCLEAFLNLKSENGNQIVHVGHAKLTCKMLGFFKYAQIILQYKCTFSLSIYVTIIVIISRCQDILFIRMIRFR